MGDFSHDPQDGATAFMYQKPGENIKRHSNFSFDSLAGLPNIYDIYIYNIIIYIYIYTRVIKHGTGQPHSLVGKSLINANTFESSSSSFDCRMVSLTLEPAP